jgi:hypothetical protein
VVVGAAFTALTVIFGVAYSFASFFASFQSEFGALRADVSLVFAISGFLWFVLGAFTGAYADRLGPRPMVIAGMLFLLDKEVLRDLRVLRGLEQCAFLRRAHASVCACPPCLCGPRRTAEGRDMRWMTKARRSMRRRNQETSLCLRGSVARDSEQPKAGTCFG